MLVNGDDVLWDWCGVPSGLARDPFEVVASEDSESDPSDEGRQMSMYSDSGSSITGANRPVVRITLSGVEVRDGDKPSSMCVLPRSGDEDMAVNAGDFRPGAVITVLPEPHVDEDGDVGNSG